MGDTVGRGIALLLGISLTVGFYEGRRLVLNTSRALTVASTQMTAGSAGGSKRDAVLQAIEEQGGDGAVAAAREERIQAIARRAEQRGAAGGGGGPGGPGAAGAAGSERARAESLARRQEVWESLSPEQREEAQARRQARLATQRHARPARGAHAPGAAPGAGEGAELAPREGAFPDEAGLTAEEQALLEDTALVLEEGFEEEP